MKKILIFLSLLVLLFINEFTLVNFSAENSLKEYNLIKIRFFNLINFVFIILIYFYWTDFIKLKIIPKFLILFFLLLSIDYLSKYAGFGYGHDKSDYHRYIFPYDWIRGKPNVLDHNQFGFRGMITPDIERDKNEIVIGLFGGSTGYNGDRVYTIQVEIQPQSVGILSNYSQIPFNICGNYPNPFNGETIISYVIPNDGYVNVSIFNVAGQFITNLVNDYQLYGEKKIFWDTKDATGNHVPSGIYYYVVSNGKYKEARTMTLLK